MIACVGFDDVIEVVNRFNACFGGESDSVSQGFSVTDSVVGVGSFGFVVCGDWIGKVCPELRERNAALMKQAWRNLSRKEIEAKLGEAFSKGLEIVWTDARK